MTVQTEQKKKKNEQSVQCEHSLIQLNYSKFIVEDMTINY